MLNLGHFFYWGKIFVGGRIMFSCFFLGIIDFGGVLLLDKKASDLKVFALKGEMCAVLVQGLVWI